MTEKVFLLWSSREPVDGANRQTEQKEWDPEPGR